MLEQCACYLIAHSEAHTRALEALARRFGFGHISAVLSGGGFHPDDGPPLKFFLFYRHMDAELMLRVRKVIRGSSDPNVRYAPIILFAEDSDFETYLNFVKMGFDDVLTLPERKEILISRLEAQINTNHIYIEAGDYLGPDRRRMEAPTHVDRRRGADARGHARHTIYRTVTAGSKAVRTELFAGARAADLATAR